MTGIIRNHAPAVLLMLVTGWAMVSADAADHTAPALPAVQHATGPAAAPPIVADRAAPALPAVQRAAPAEDAQTARLRAELTQVDAEIARLRAQGSLDNLRLQQLTERRSKLMQSLSNVMKKSNETSQGVIQNIK